MVLLANLWNQTLRKWDTSLKLASRFPALVLASRICSAVWLLLLRSSLEMQLAVWVCRDSASLHRALHFQASRPKKGPSVTATRAHALCLEASLSLCRGVSFLVCRASHLSVPQSWETRMARRTEGCFWISSSTGRRGRKGRWSSFVLLSKCQKSSHSSFLPPFWFW